MNEAARWGLGKRFGVLFVGVLFTLLLVPDIISSVPIVGWWLAIRWRALWAGLMPILGNAALGIEAEVQVPAMDGGSGDMTWHYVQTLWFVVIALATAGLVTALDRRRDGYARAYAGLRVLVRYGLLLPMFSYGSAKLFGFQFNNPPGTLELTRMYGESSPHGLVWTFMGYSKAYLWFTGLAEVLAGALLLTRRTTTLGALVACGVMANVVAINFCYDVSAKLYSSQLLLMAVFLAVHDARRLADLFVFNRTAPPVDLGPHIADRRWRIARIVGKTSFVLWLTLGMVMNWWFMKERAATATAKPGPLSGAWAVKAFAVDGAPVQDASHWRLLYIDESEFAVRPIEGEVRSFGCTQDAEANTLTLVSPGEGAEETHVLQVESPAPDRMVLRGKLPEGTIEATLQRIDTSKMLLVSRGFRWVSEAPFNR